MFLIPKVKGFSLSYNAQEQTPTNTKTTTTTHCPLILSSTSLLSNTLPPFFVFWVVVCEFSLFIEKRSKQTVFFGYFLAFIQFYEHGHVFNPQHIVRRNMTSPLMSEPIQIIEKLNNDISCSLDPLNQFSQFPFLVLLPERLSFHKANLSSRFISQVTQQQQEQQRKETSFFLKNNRGL